MGGGGGGDSASQKTCGRPARSNRMVSERHLCGFSVVASTRAYGGISRAVPARGRPVATPVPLPTLVPLLYRHGHGHDHAVATEAVRTRSGRLEPFA